MLVHCTQKIAGKLPGVSTLPLEEQSPLGSWSANLLRLDRIQCVLFCHDETRYALFLPGVRKPQFQELGRWHRQLFLATLIVFGVEESQLCKVELALGPVSYDRATDRSVLSSMHQLEYDIAARLHRVPHVLDLDPVTMSAELSHRPATIRGKWLWPEKAMLERIAAL